LEKSLVLGREVEQAGIITCKLYSEARENQRLVTRQFSVRPAGVHDEGTSIGRVEFQSVFMVSVGVLEKILWPSDFRNSPSWLPIKVAIPQEHSVSGAVLVDVKNDLVRGACKGVNRHGISILEEQDNCHLQLPFSTFQLRQRYFPHGKTPKPLFRNDSTDGPRFTFILRIQTSTH
jgi:hypothetical protein